MTLKTFNVQEEVYEKFSTFCKERGISMSKQVELFMESQIGPDTEVKKEYLNKLKKIREGKYHKFNTVAQLRGLIENE